MVLPLVAGIGITIVALVTKTSLSAYRQYIHLTPVMIATLNNIRLTTPSSKPLDRSDPRYAIYERIRNTYPNRGFNEPMSEQEALLILGIEGDDILRVNRDMVRQRYRELMKVNHPDREGGSVFLSMKINQAKDVLDKSYMMNK
ncbi:MDJ2 [[Candida] subhashii]|uniref:MDJ2 n=1 Tax=[Candida] subhashii TaxID=561895 RepID=A0A8J5QRZ6_9ASCO|nr:MDJ2 [[Candida] subhashii]KAG7665363.1 MDJ2 [[Candida] subhashii]